MPKTKGMLFSKSHNIDSALKIENNVLERINHFRYIGFYLGKSCEIRTGVEQVKAAFVKMKNILTTRDLRIALRLRILRCFSVLSYEAEVWTLSDATHKKHQAFEM